MIVSVGMFDELCRVYLDWLEAPEEWSENIGTDMAEIYPDEYMIGKRPAGGGERVSEVTLDVPWYVSGQGGPERGRSDAGFAIHGQRLQTDVLKTGERPGEEVRRAVNWLHAKYGAAMADLLTVEQAAKQCGVSA